MSESGFSGLKDFQDKKGDLYMARKKKQNKVTIDEDKSALPLKGISWYSDG